MQTHYRGMDISIAENDSELLGYFQNAAQHKLVVKQCSDCGLLRWDPGAGCPRCQSLAWSWHEVSGKGTIYSYCVATQPFHQSFADLVPYVVIVVELDEQRGEPSPNDGLRLTANLVDDRLNPEKEEKVAIGKRAEVVFQDIGEGFAIPQFKLAGESTKAPTWQYPG